MEKVYERLGANLDKEGEGTLRKISPEVLQELKNIFDISGGTELFDNIEKYSIEKAKDINLYNNENLDEYIKFISI